MKLDYIKHDIYFNHETELLNKEHINDINNIYPDKQSSIYD